MSVNEMPTTARRARCQARAAACMYAVWRARGGCSACGAYGKRRRVKVVNARCARANGKRGMSATPRVHSLAGYGGRR